MAKKSYESYLQDYLTKNNGLNLKKIDPGLELVEKEHAFKGGRIDILAEKNSTPVGIELKFKDYQTRGICAQLLNYLNYLTEKKGEIYFVAPKIKYGIYSTLKGFYEDKKLRFFEVTYSKGIYSFSEIVPSSINDLKRKTVDSFYPSETNHEFVEKMIRGIYKIIPDIPDKKKAKLINSIIDDRKSKQKHLEDIAESVIDILSMQKNSSIKKAYDILKIL